MVIEGANLCDSINQDISMFMSELLQICPLWVPSHPWPLNHREQPRKLQQFMEIEVHISYCQNVLSPFIGRQLSSGGPECLEKVCISLELANPLGTKHSNPSSQYYTFTWLLEWGVWWYNSWPNIRIFEGSMRERNRFPALTVVPLLIFEGSDFQI